jgi:hypothetical protein
MSMESVYRLKCFGLLFQYTKASVWSWWWGYVYAAINICFHVEQSATLAHPQAISDTPFMIHEKTNSAGIYCSIAVGMELGV